MQPAYSFFQPKVQATAPKYASGVKKYTKVTAAPSKAPARNNYSKPTTQINLRSDSQNSKNSGLGSARSNGSGVFNRLSSAKQRPTSNSRKAAIPGRLAGSGIRLREQEQIVVPKSPAKFAHYRTENRLNESDDDDMMDSNSQSDQYSISGRLITKPMSLYKSNLDKQVAKVYQNQGLPIVGCMPGCTHNHKHEYDYDYTKNYMDALNRRPGEFVEYNWMAANYYLLQEGKQGVVCEGILQTPINLETSIPITKEFKDYNFEFQYAELDAKKQVKFNQKGQQMQVVLESPQSPLQNFFRTSTIGLFEPKIECCNLHGLQYHFHAPSEHSVNGQLMDLEMHIVHGFEPAVKEHTVLSHGVLGFFFKAVPEDFPFALHGGTDFHDRFMKQMLEDSQNSKGVKTKKLDLTKFVQLLQYNRRWTYTGSLTTAPFSEGILWNVLEHVIPLRQSTLDMFLEYRKIEEKQVFNHFANKNERAEVLAKLSIQPNNVKPYVTPEGESFFRVAACNRVVQDKGDRAVYHIDIEP